MADKKPKETTMAGALAGAQAVINMRDKNRRENNPKIKSGGTSIPKSKGFDAILGKRNK